MYDFDEEMVKGILFEDYQDRAELISCAGENLRESLRGVSTLGELEDIARWMLSYIEAAKRVRG